MGKHPHRISFLNTYIDSVTTQEALEEVDRLICSGKPSYVVTPNSDIVVQMQDDEDLKKICEAADLILTDGMVLVRISEKLGNPIKERVCMTDFVWEVGRLAQKKGYGIFMFGGKVDVLEKARSNFQTALPGLKVVGSYSPPMGFEDNELEYAMAIRAIKQARPDILLVFLGCPKQEKFISRSIGDLGVPISIPMGGCVDFLAGEVARAPKWMQKHSLEWLFRFLQDPKRLFKRYFIEDMRIFKLAYEYAKE